MNRKTVGLVTVHFFVKNTNNFWNDFNEVFHISYPEDIEIVQFHNKNQFQDGKLITDARLLIAGSYITSNVKVQMM